MLPVSGSSRWRVIAGGAQSNKAMPVRWVAHAPWPQSAPGVGQPAVGLMLVNMAAGPTQEDDCPVGHDVACEAGVIAHVRGAAKCR